MFKRISSIYVGHWFVSGKTFIESDRLFTPLKNTANLDIVQLTSLVKVLLLDRCKSCGCNGGGSPASNKCLSRIVAL